MISIGIDNGVSGSIAVVEDGRLHSFYEMPVRKVLHWGKAGRFRNRIYQHGMHAVIGPHNRNGKTRAIIERPMVNPKMFQSSLSAVAALEAVEIALEFLGIGYEVVDSRAWQRRYLGDVKGSSALKAASLARGIQMFPQFADAFRKHGDADSVFLALLASDR